MSVKRYDLVGDMDGNCNLNEARMEHSDDGSYVSYEDYAALETRCEALAAENAEMKEEISNITFMRDDDFFGSTQRAQEVMGRLVNIKTPETDASLAEVRAKGVEMFAIEWGGHDSPYGQDAYNFAEQIRKGVQS
ncbi:TPA: hypothetical protein QCK10_001499 [Enterobacter roggenkampii]|nr:hypothetical protein [Enterobacter roggenkampii]